ncbi:hypothetical protein [Streptomonospora wellingtoniae]|uniref:Lipoprotein n=1 Tax=Streptomonospora wellingtoniae TaxID=3075544 RepID=A0ABU2KMK1_9ACTN|nr:hypothetical protein [Streptomonospora sp. DSM 45055]MDT0300496.1 hypothetical protein [Streptomonospora sp. DSM 45055]
MPVAEPAALTVRGAAMCVFALLGGCGAAPEADDGAEREEPVRPPPSATAGMDAEADPTTAPETVYVFNTHGNEQGEADQRPENLVASQSTTFTGLEWLAWGGGPAVAEGDVQGTWCLPDCQDSPYPVTVELSGAETVDGTAFYTGYTFTGRSGFPEEMRGRVRDVGSGRLMLPTAW